MLDCDRCGAIVLPLTPGDLLALVPVENLDVVRHAIEFVGPGAVASICPRCKRCALTNDPVPSSN